MSLLYLDFDLYEPTKCAFPRMPKGAVVAFDELNHAAWPGETMALLDTLGIAYAQAGTLSVPAANLVCLPRLM